MRIILWLSCCLWAISAMTQTSQKPISSMIESVQVNGTQFKEIQPFYQSRNAFDQRSDLTRFVKKGTLLRLSPDVVTGIIRDQPEAISLNLPTINRNAIQLDLVKVSVVSDDFIVSTDKGPYTLKPEVLGVHYRGIIKGKETSLASISFYGEEIMGMVSESDMGNIIVGKLGGENESGEHLVYSDLDLKENVEYACETPDPGKPYTREQLMPRAATDFRDVGDCVSFYVEADYDLYQNKGGTDQTITYLTGAFNQVQTLYANENLSTTVSEMFVWSSPSPYSGSSSSGFLDQFQNTRPNYNGDLAILINLANTGGVAYVNGLCSFNKIYSMGYAGINTNFNNVPNYSWTVDVIAHELGHLFGSQHTHACVWNGNGSAIDGCYNTEGGCANPGYPTKGTIMSYCHLGGRPGKDFTLGFGPQPGNLIRNRVAAASCLGTACSGGGNDPNCNDGIQNGDETGVDCGGSCTPCATCNDGIQNGGETGIDCGGPDCGPCNTDNCTEVTLSITLDNYGSETTWQIKDANGSILLSGGPYGDNVNGTVVTATQCLPYGCYDFEINDAYGDGICCSYGNGSYNLKDASGNTLASGGNFGSTDATTFCLGETNAPTCTDGVQNGDETGVDCGGSCTPCVTCNDGVQNGDETGIDCGGSCSPCNTSSCADGAQNGDETGIDCGGSCSPCDTGGGECTDVTLTLILDNYGSETTWAIASAEGGSIVASGGPYNDGINGTAVSATVCLSDGCYDFQINDAYGDGICCSYGNGSFLLADADGNTLASGGSFTNAAAQNFCFGEDDGGNNATPTCDDGIQNGDETGIDCGGSCTPCNTTSDDCFTEETDFEEDLGIWVDGGSDCSRINSSLANSGFFAVRLRDNTSSSTLTSENLELGGSTGVIVEFNYIGISMDNPNEDFWLQVSTDGGNTFNTIKTWKAGVDFQNNVRAFESVLIPGPFTNSTKIRFRCDASSNSDYVYLDDISVTNCGYGNMPESGDEIGQGVRKIEMAQILNLYPNPTKAQFEVAYNLTASEQVQIVLTDFTGKTIQSHTINAKEGQHKYMMDASQLASGFYFVQLKTKDRLSTKKLVVNH